MACKAMLLDKTTKGMRVYREEKETKDSEVRQYREVTGKRGQAAKETEALTANRVRKLPGGIETQVCVCQLDWITGVQILG